MSKPVLTLPHDYLESESWNKTLYRMMARSGVWDIQTEQFPVAPRIPGNRRGSNFTLLRVNGVLLALDTWDDNNPSSLYESNGCFATGGCFADVKMVLKIQYRNNGYWNTFHGKTGILATPWTVMPSRVFPMEFFKWENKAHKYFVSTTGRNNRFGRGKWVDACKARGDCYIPDQHINHKDDMEVYQEVLRNVRWGLVLQGLPRSDGKNRRETEFGSCGIPLALNYKPTYPFEFEAGKHFVYTPDPKDLAALATIDPEPYSKAITEIYNKYWSPAGMSNLLLDLCRKNKLIE